MTLDGDHHHPQMTIGDHPLVVSRANPAAAVVSQGRAAQVQARLMDGVHLAQMTGVHLPRVRAERVAQAVVNRVRAEVDLEMDGEAGDLILVHGDQVLAVRVARAAQAAERVARAEVDQALEIGVQAQMIRGALDHPRVNRASLVVDQASLESLEEDQVDQATGVSFRCRCGLILCTFLLMLNIFSWYLYR